MRSFAIALTMLLAGALPSLAQERAFAPSVAVVGQAEDWVRPDTAFINLNVTDDRASASDAANENARLTNAVIDGLRSAGIETKDISTVGLSLYPLMSDTRASTAGQPLKPVVTGFRAANVLRVRVREIDRTGALVALSVQNGALYEGVAFDLSDRVAREDALRVKAVVNARRRAELYAEGAAMKLGALRSLAGQAAAGPAPVFAAARTMAAATPSVGPLPIEPGLIALSQSVDASWELIAP